MKVTVCFGEVRVLVPCGAGDLLVRDLVREATHRYKKATGKGPESWVEVRALRASSGGILDPDDRVRDVADDRETLAAECAGVVPLAHAHAPPPPPPPRQHGGDGASGSSVGTASPDMFRGGSGARRDADLGVEVAAADLEGAGGLQVRRGSEPTLHQDSLPVQAQLNEHTKRWSAAVVCREEARPPPPEPPPDAARAAHPFQRHTNRLSMQFSGPGSGVWLDAAERVQTTSTKSLPRDSRKEPLGQDTTASDHQNHRVEDMLRWVSGVNGTAETPPAHDRPLHRLPEVNGAGAAGGGAGGAEVAVGGGGARPAAGGQLLSVALVKGERGLGFTITTRDNPTGGHAPIYIKNILPKGAAVMDGRLRAGDRLVSVNGAAVSGLAQQQVVAVLRNTPTDSTVTLLVERPRTNMQRVEPQQSPAKYAEKAVGSPNSIAAMNKLSAENGRVSGIVSALNQSGRRARSGEDLKRNTSDSALHDTLNSSNVSSASAAGLRRRQVLRLEVPVHDSEKAGLGVSVKGKVTVGAEPQDLGIFVKSVLNGGAASRDGRLHTNDQLLSVNGVSLAGQSNAEAMETLRRALLHSRGNQHGTISLTVARRTESMDSLARWKDDTPPSGHESSGNSTSDNAHTTVICRAADTRNNNVVTDANHNHKLNDSDRGSGKRHASIVNINNNGSWVSNQSDDSKGCRERKTPERDVKRDSFEWSRLDGWNPVIDRLTGLRNESYYMATQTDPPANGHAAHPGHPGLRYGHLHMRSPPQHNVIIEEDYGTTTKARSPATNGGVYESGSESAGETAFSRDAVGRRSMSEKRHAAVDAKTTGTYKKIKEQKAINALQSVGPTLGMRKSSSLESLQTAVQEQQRQPVYSSRLHQHPPLKHWLTDTEPTGAETMVRGSPQQSSLSHKKPSLLKSLSSMLRFGKQPKKPEEVYGRSAPGRASEKSLSREALERTHAHAERTLSERGPERDERRHSERAHPQRGHERLAEPRVPEHPDHRSVAGHARQASGEEERRAAHAPHAPPYRLPPARARAQPSAHTMSQVMEGAWGASGHYVNYEEIQQNLNARREKLSEVQIGQMRRQVHAQRAKADEESRRAGVGGGYHSQRSSREATAAARPQSNYYEYESVAPAPHGRAAKLHYH